MNEAAKDGAQGESQDKAEDSIAVTNADANNKGPAQTATLPAKTYYIYSHSTHTTYTSHNTTFHTHLPYLILITTTTYRPDPS